MDFRIFHYRYIVIVKYYESFYLIILTIYFYMALLQYLRNRFVDYNIIIIDYQNTLVCASKEQNLEIICYHICKNEKNLTNPTLVLGFPFIAENTTLCISPLCYSPICTILHSSCLPKPLFSKLCCPYFC